uniref:Uncharacterized protein n=1 Tax=Arundo donax TaxID=35708 RepID=A0A0A9F1N4_ARUDO
MQCPVFQASVCLQIQLQVQDHEYIMKKGKKVHLAFCLDFHPMQQPEPQQRQHERYNFYGKVHQKYQNNQYRYQNQSGPINPPLIQQPPSRDHEQQSTGLLIPANHVAQSA